MFCTCMNDKLLGKDKEQIEERKREEFFFSSFSGV